MTHLQLQRVRQVEERDAEQYPRKTQPGPRHAFGTGAGGVPPCEQTLVVAQPHRWAVNAAQTSAERRLHHGRLARREGRTAMSAGRVGPTGHSGAMSEQQRRAPA